MLWYFSYCHFCNLSWDTCIAWLSVPRLGEFFEVLRHCDGVVGMQQDDVADGLLELISAGRPELLRGQWHSHSLLQDTHTHTHIVDTTWPLTDPIERFQITQWSQWPHMLDMYSSRTKHDNHCPFTKTYETFQFFMFHSMHYSSGLIRLIDWLTDYVHQGCIYLIKNTERTEILLNKYCIVCLRTLT